MRSLVALSLGAAVVAGGALLAPTPLAARALSFAENLPLIGTGGGHSFTRNCPAGSVLTGVRWRTGAVVDGIGIQCSTVRSDGTLGPRTDVGSMAGGNGGTAGRDDCHGGVVAGQNGATAGVSLGSLFFRCFQWSPAARAYTGAVNYTINVRIGLLISASESQCHDGDKPAVGLYGRHGSFIDAVGVICGKP
ncbi:hypothetical protein J421_1207 [Gemmatirosa kalamazoonensis]|uniref:Uncharacterized protein n=1 Tax=Gemmatirosa kalamazoonensis TaxID=861299 RepID=W0RCD5_9BACT|nr:hypothetical protein [Gemmatirosa kalamazoonensis]AHG88744.1 hypothetical protein J421_1207 [Gemmatirosa kalamazoonensis]